MVIFGLILFATTAYGQCFRPYLEEGDKLRNQGRCEDAIKVYTKGMDCVDADIEVLNQRIALCRGGGTNTSSTTGKSCGSVKDYNGNTYKTVQIGSQCWMAENMRTTVDRDGRDIQTGKGGSETSMYRYCPDGEQDNVPQYAYLYNWPAAVKICPKGWHLPTEADWTKLTDYLSSQSKYTCGSKRDNIAKAMASTTGWMSKKNNDPCMVGNHPEFNNASGFNALPAGFNKMKYAYGLNYLACIWSATSYSEKNAYFHVITISSPIVNILESNKAIGGSVRCVKD